jgi:KDO2-lipid IV(A) lauroyltransferase
VERVGDERLAALRARGQGVVVATGHIGPWQLGPYLLEEAGHTPLVLAMAREPDARAQALEQLLAMRRRFRVVYTDEPFASLALLRALKDGGVVAAQMDRPPPLTNAKNRLRAPFFDGEAAFAAGPAVLARVTGAALVPVFLIAHGPSRVRVEVGEAVDVAHTRDREADVAAATRGLARAYEACVRAHPYQWYAFHDFWAQA